MFEVVRPWYVCLQMLKIEIIWFQPITHKDKKQINLLHDFLRFLGTHFCMKINLKIAPVTYIVSSGSNCNWASMKIFWFGMLNMPVFYFAYSLFILVLFSKKVLIFYYLRINGLLCRFTISKYLLQPLNFSKRTLRKCTIFYFLLACLPWYSNITGWLICNFTNLQE